ncbi:MAG TPA: ribonuclease P protein component [Candidatus Krumholzibacteria bacterium]|nr:ribonuclease P protein component [Candidatus Krumholzibacteria bacterium]
MDSSESTRPPGRRLRPLPLPWQFRYCYDGGRRIVTRYAVVFMRAATDTDGLRIGVVASRKVGGAVKRNRARRLLRETARSLVPRWHNRSIWVVFVARESINQRNAHDVREDIERALTENGAFAAPDESTRK